MKERNSNGEGTGKEIEEAKLNVTAAAVAADVCFINFRARIIKI